MKYLIILIINLKNGLYFNESKRYLIAYSDNSKYIYKELKNTFHQRLFNLILIDIEYTIIINQDKVVFKNKNLYNSFKKFE